MQFLNSFDHDECDLVLGDVKLFIEIAVRYFSQSDNISTQILQITTGKPVTEACADVLTLLLVRIA
jgi:hypothetical protein